MKSKVTLPVIIIAVIGLVAFLVFMGRSYLASPGAIHTTPPPWIDPATGKPKEASRGSSPGTPVIHRGPPGAGGQ